MAAAAAGDETFVSSCEHAQQVSPLARKGSAPGALSVEHFAVLSAPLNYGSCQLVISTAAQGQIVSSAKNLRAGCAEFMPEQAGGSDEPGT